MQVPEPEWKDDCFGHPQQAMYIGKLIVGTIMHAGTSKFVPNGTPWRGWFNYDEDGRATGWFATARESRASVEAALKAALEET